MVDAKNIAKDSSKKPLANFFNICSVNIMKGVRHRGLKW